MRVVEHLHDAYFSVYLSDHMMVGHFPAIEDFDGYSFSSDCVFCHCISLTSHFRKGPAAQDFPHMVVTGLAHIHNC